MSEINKKTKRELQSIATRERILESADKVFADKGMNNVQIKDICNEANISVGTFYHYFENKDDLIITKFWEFDEIYTQIPRDYFSKSDSIENLVDFSCFFARDTFVNKTKRKAVEYLKARLSVTIESLQPRNRPYFPILLHIIEEGQINGQIRKDMSKEEIGDLIMVITRGYAFDWASKDGSYDLKEMMENNLPIVFSSLRI